MEEGIPAARFACNLLRGEIAAEAVVARRFLARRLLLSHLLQALGRAEAAVGVPARQQSRGVLPVEVGPLALPVGTERAADVRPLVPIEAEPAQDIDDPLLGSFDIAVAVGVLDAEQEGAVPSLAPGLPVRQQPVEERGAGAADVQQPGRARREPDADGRGVGGGVSHQGENLFALKRPDTRRRVYAAYLPGFAMLAVHCIELCEREESSMLRGREHLPDVVVVPRRSLARSARRTPWPALSGLPGRRPFATRSARSAAFTSPGRCRAATTG